MFSTFYKKKMLEYSSQDRVCNDIFTCNEKINLRCANATIKEIVQMAVAKLHAHEPVVAVLD